MRKEVEREESHTGQGADEMEKQKAQGRGGRRDKRQKWKKCHWAGIAELAEQVGKANTGGNETANTC